MLDVIIPTCAADREQAEILLRSLDTFAAADLVGSLNLVCVDRPESLDSMRALRAHKFQPRTTYLELGDLGLTSSPTPYANGWVVQQMAKLIFARFAKTDFYLALDSKNFARETVRFADLVQQGRAGAFLEDVEIHDAWWRGSMRMLKHRRFDRRPGRLALSAATPVLLHTRTVREMLNGLERAYGKPFEDIFSRRTMLHRSYPIEFTLYYTYLDRECLFDRLHFRSTRLHEATTMSWAGMADHVVMERLNRLTTGRPEGLFSCVHRPIWNTLDLQVKQRLRALACGGAAID
jgi:hypothetical protein